MGDFSGVLRLTDLNDFIGPSDSCILPVSRQTIGDVADGGQVKIQSSSKKQPVENATTQQISLDDCLACSGCVTSAESVLIAEQSESTLVQRLTTTLGESGSISVASVAPQCIASLGARYGIDYAETKRRLAGLLKRRLGIAYVFDTTFARSLTLLETLDEFLRRESGSGPLITSACPGWICYAEKSQPQLLDYISRVRSPQQVQGSLVKDYLVRKLGLSRRASVYHVAVMPCFDKKLEASRTHFRDADECRDVDIVVTPIELERLLGTWSATLSDFEEMEFDSPLQFSGSGSDDDECNSGHFGSGSGGYLENILVGALRHLSGGGVEISPDSLRYRVLRNRDFQEVEVSVDGEDLRLRGAICYGFRNIQTLTQRIKRKRCQYDVIELMACPSGCLNGGGQIRAAEDGGSGASSDLLQRVDELYRSAPKLSLQQHVDAWLSRFYDEWLGERVRLGDVGGDVGARRQALLYTSYAAVKSANTLQILW